MDELSTLNESGKPPITFHKGRLHTALHVHEGEVIPTAKREAALAGDYGPAVKKMAVFAFRGALAKGRKTVGVRR